jgi:hypothetical protein
VQHPDRELEDPGFCRAPVSVLDCAHGTQKENEKEDDIEENCFSQGRDDEGKETSQAVDEDKSCPEAGEEAGLP